VTFDDFPNGERTREPDGAWKNWYRTVDLRLARSLFNREGKKFTVIAEVFNVFNSDNVLSYNGRQFDNNGGLLEAFGTPTGAFSARQGQVGFGWISERGPGSTMGRGHGRSREGG
jgi:hypothetical protein